MTIKNIFILGGGGHGITLLTKYLISSKSNFQIYYNTTDWGGSQGLWGRMLELNNFELERQLFNTTESFLPFADLNKTLIEFSRHSSRKDNLEDLNHRSHSLKEALAEFTKLANVLGLKLQDELAFKGQMKQIWAFNYKNRPKIKYFKEICFGYFWHQRLFNKTKNIKDWNKYWQDLGFLPHNVDLKFSQDIRTTLIATDINLTAVISEEVIDFHKQPFLADQVFIQSKDLRSELPLSQEFLNDLRAADVVLIPSGTICNWIGFCNYGLVRNILGKKKLVWLCNPRKSRNELPIKDYYEFLVKINPEVVALTSIKKQVNFGMKVLELDENGKHDPDQMAEVLHEVLEG